MRTAKELLLSVAVIVFAWVSLTNRRLPIQVQDFLFFVVLALEIGLIVLGWWSWKKGRGALDGSRWRRGIGFAGIVSNTVAFGIPLFLILYPFPRQGSRLPMIDGEWMLNLSLVLALCGFVAGIFAPPKSRAVTALAGLILALMLVAIPRGIL